MKVYCSRARWGRALIGACGFALSQSLHQIQLAQSVEAGIGIGFAVRSECRIDQRNPRGVGWPDFLEQLAAASWPDPRASHPPNSYRAPQPAPSARHGDTEKIVSSG